ncbi:MAG: cation diffusion facilitator family transporter [Pseudomonadota bacterium]
MSVALLMASIKAFAWFMTDSVAVLSSLLDSLLDVVASTVTLVAIRSAQVPADRDHRFGHGKAEPLAALAQSAFVAGSAVLLLFEAGHRFIHPRAVERPELGIGVIAFTIVVTLALVSFQVWVTRRTGSIAINADALHYKGDLLMNAGVIAALILSGWYGWIYADPIFAIGIAVYILANAWTIVHEALDMLMDKELPEEEREQIYRIAESHPGTRHAHDLRTRRSGQMTLIQLHLEMDRDISLFRAHQIAEEVQAKILEAFPGAEVIIHQDPEGLEEHHPQIS